MKGASRSEQTSALKGAHTGSDGGKQYPISGVHMWPRVIDEPMLVYVPCAAISVSFVGMPWLMSRRCSEGCRSPLRTHGGQAGALAPHRSAETGKRHFLFGSSSFEFMRLFAKTCRVMTRHVQVDANDRLSLQLLDFPAVVCMKSRLCPAAPTRQDITPRTSTVDPEISSSPSLPLLQLSKVYLWRWRKYAIGCSSIPFHARYCQHQLHLDWLNLQQF